MSETTARHVHVVLGSCLDLAARKGVIARSPVQDAERVPSVAQFDHVVLDADELARLLAGFKGMPIFPIVAVCAMTGARLREVLAMRWQDVDLVNRTISIRRAIEEAKQYRGIKAPKTVRGKRTFAIDDGLTAMLTERLEWYRRLVAGIPDGADADTTLIKLPVGALLFPGGDGASDLKRLRDGGAVYRSFKRQIVKLGFDPSLRLHDLRGSYETILLDPAFPSMSSQTGQGTTPR
jgi:integrase